MTGLVEPTELKMALQRSETAFHAMLGMMSPLWIAFGAAASAGAAFWLISRSAGSLRMDAPAAASDRSALVEAALEPAAEATARTMNCVADDLTRLSGVGPKIANALAERGVERFAQLAAWTAGDLAAFDAALGLRGRAVRADFIAQARRLAAGEA
jgi:predicted flap endonuclease-1-like 5' DNA nuclease